MFDPEYTQNLQELWHSFCWTFDRQYEKVCSDIGLPTRSRYYRINKDNIPVLCIFQNLFLQSVRMGRYFINCSSCVINNIIQNNQLMRITIDNESRKNLRFIFPASLLKVCYKQQASNNNQYTHTFLIP